MVCAIGPNQYGAYRCLHSAKGDVSALERATEVVDRTENVSCQMEKGDHGEGRQLLRQPHRCRVASGCIRLHHNHQSFVVAKQSGDTVA